MRNLFLKLVKNDILAHFDSNYINQKNMLFRVNDFFIKGDDEIIYLQTYCGTYTLQDNKFYSPNEYEPLNINTL